jgi:hypothetical protein
LPTMCALAPMCTSCIWGHKFVVYGMTSRHG